MVCLVRSRCRCGRSRPSVAGTALPLLLLGATATAAYQLDTSSPDSIKSIAADMTEDMMSFYTGNQRGQTPGLLPQPYYWWEAGAMMGALIDYWYYTGDSQYNDIATQALLFQVGANNDYMPNNQTLTEGNDDQGFWGLSVMTAAEYKFPNPPADQPQWLALAQAVFNTQAARWDTADCNGGLRWQIFTWNNGYDYKNSISQACFFNLAARLALYTGNQTYFNWANTTWNWMVDIKFMDENYYIYDGSHIETGCTKLTPYQWSYNAGAFLLGAAAMYNYTSLLNDTDTAALWRERTEGLLNGTHVFFAGNDSNIMSEVACEPVNLCDLDQQSFKAYLSRWMAATTKWAPFTESTIMPLLQSSAVAAASQCTGGSNGRMCGLKWTDNGKWDGSTGVGQQMAAMEVTLANMIQDVTAPVTNTTGGTSQGNPNAGAGDIGRTQPESILDLLGPVTAGDRVGASILTVIFAVGLVAGVIFMLTDETVDRTPKERWVGFVAAVGKNSKRLTKRGGGGILGNGTEPAMSEKDKQPRVQSFKVLDRSESDRSSGSVAYEDGVLTQRQSSVQFVPPPTIAGSSGAPERNTHDSGATGGNTNRASDPGFFAPAHFRQHSNGHARTKSTRHRSHLSDPGIPTTIQYPATAAASAVPAPIAESGATSTIRHSTDAANVPTRREGRRSLIKRKPTAP